MTTITTTPVEHRRRRRERMALSVSAVLASTAVFGMGAAASFTTSVAAPQTISSGSVLLELGDTGSVTNRITVDATNIVPGDTIQRSVDLINNGTVDLASAALTSEATTSSLLDTRTDLGLQMSVDSCSVQWNETAVNGGFEYTCDGVTSNLVSTRPVIQADMDLAGIAALDAGATSHLRVTLELPSEADNDFQNQSSTIEYSFSGIQRAAESR